MKAERLDFADQAARRSAFMKARREALRAVKRTLAAIALLGGGLYLGLLAREKKLRNHKREQSGE